MTNVLIPDSVISIGSSAFADCTNLAEITIPAQVKSLTYYTFENCTNLTSIRFKSISPPAIDSSAFDNAPIEKIIVPDGVTEYDIGIDGIVITYDPPVFTSSESASSIAENSGTDQAIYTAQATDDSGVTYSLKPVEDYTSFSIDSTTGDVRIVEDPDYESKSSYSFTVIASDPFGNTSQKAVTLAINDVEEIESAEETAASVEEDPSWVPEGWVYFVPALRLFFLRGSLALFQ